jgi:hypothetical protein
MTTDLSVTQTGSVFAISVCKLRSERGIHTEITKNTKERMTTDLSVTQTGSVLAIFAISVCKLRSERGIHTEVAKNAKERTTTDPKGRSIRTGLSDLCDLCV